MDCGLLPGERWWVTLSGVLVSDDGLRAVDARICDLPVGVTLSVLVVDVPPPRTVLYVVPPCEDGAAWTAVQVPLVVDYVVSRGVARDTVDVTVGPCGAAPRVDVNVAR
jgi:hypothetical protein